jgi:hypothetical protein
MSTSASKNTVDFNETITVNRAAYNELVHQLDIKDAQIVKLQAQAAKYQTQIDKYLTQIERLTAKAKRNDTAANYNEAA